MGFDPELELSLESGIPETLETGVSTAVFLYGSCYHRRQAIESVEVSVDGRTFKAVSGMPRLDLFESLHPLLPPGEVTAEHDAGSLEDPEMRSFRSGFWATADVPAGTEPGTVSIEVEAKLEDGSIARALLAEIEITAPRTPSADIEEADPAAAAIYAAESLAAAAPKGLTAIAMATHNPDMDLFRVQVESIKTQTETNWICLVSDDCSLPDTWAKIEEELAGDDRFILSRSELRLGFYRNFERTLEMVPAGAEFVALCDQDDRWYEGKLAALKDGLGKNQLVYSDQRLVDTEGNVIAETYWSTRRNNFQNFASLLIANTVTGAASLFRREMLDYALPFPEAPGEQFHDHWLGLVAMCSGGLAYVDRPLYDYVQHGSAVLGHDAANAGISSGKKPSRKLSIGAVRQYFSGWRSAYFYAYLRLSVLSQVLLVRCGKVMGSRKRRTLKRYIAAERSPLGFGWLLTRPIRDLFGRNETLGVERLLIQGILWRYIIAWRNRGQVRPSGSVYDASLPPVGRAEKGPAHNHPQTAHIQRMVRPLDLSVTETAPVRVNVLIPTFDLKHLFGGYIGKFNLARKLAEAGFRTRIVTVDPSPPLPKSWREQVQSYSGLEGAFDNIEIAFARDQGGSLEVNPDDRFVATTWWTAHLANDAVSKTNSDHFLYMIQEYEPFTFVMGSWSAMAAATYDFPHKAIFSTELLREFFRNHRYGVFSESEEAGERDSISFQNAITKVVPPTASDLNDRKSRKLLYYARPEAHAARNMFELGLIALQTAVERGVFGPEWTFHGIGTVEGTDRMRLAEGVDLEILPRKSQGSYGDLLAAHDLGLSLMITPHPSLPPIEMASAGMLTVTNTFENKTAEALTSISPNLIPCPPTVDGLVDGLARAVAAMDDGDQRVAGAAVNWSDDWEESLNDVVMERVVSFIG